MSNQLGRNEACWCGSGQKYKKCHAAIEEQIASCAAKGCEVPDRSLLKTAKQIEGIRESSKLNIALLDYIGDFAVEGDDI